MTGVSGRPPGRWRWGAAVSAATHEEAFVSLPPPALRAPVVAIVEDDSSLLAALRFALEQEGLEVRTFATAEALLAASPPADCLVVDHFLPGITGLELIGLLHEQEVSVPAILITSPPSPSLAAQVEALGIVLVEKPLFGDSLVDAIRLGLAQSHLSDAD
jgi:two-component system, LuxR family, response regulator FixJ